MTVREFAMALGVSPAIVARSIHGHGRSSSATRAGILARIPERGVTHGIDSRHLPHGQTNMPPLGFGVGHGFLAAPSSKALKMSPHKSPVGIALWLGTTLLAAAVGAREVRAGTDGTVTNAFTPLRLDVADDGKQIKLLVRHPEIGLICELHCYEGGPFQYGTAARRGDGSVVLVHTSGKMTATTTFTPQGDDRIAMDVRVEGPLEELKQVNYVGPCMQFWHSDAFKRRDSLVEFAGRCFLYTMRGPVGMLDTARGPMSSFKPDAPENSPPCTQWYVPIRAMHPGNIWGFGASGDRPVYGVVGVASRDGKWLAAIGCASTNTLGQGWHDCIHHVPQLQAYLDERAGRILHRSMLYVMPNDRRKLLESFRHDFPAAPGRSQVSLSIGKEGALRVGPPSRKGSGLDLRLGVVTADGQPAEEQNPSWEASPWGGLVRHGSPWKMWAYPNGEGVEVCVSLAPGAGLARVEAALHGNGWTLEQAPRDVPALVRRSPDGAWIAALIWEQSERDEPARGVPKPGQGAGGSVSTRGRLHLYKGDIAALRALWVKDRVEWEHSVPFRMPFEASADSAPKEVRP